MSSKQRFAEILDSVQIQGEGSNSRQDLPKELWDELWKMKDAAFIGLDEAVYAGTSYGAENTKDHDHYWLVKTPDHFAAASVNHQAEGGFFVSIEFEGESALYDLYGYDVYEAPDDVSEAVFRLLPESAINEMTSAVSNNPNFDQDGEAQRLVDWILRSRNTGREDRPGFGIE